MRSKEEIAAELRKLLGVDIKFEKLSREELIQLAEAIDRLLEKAEKEELEEEKEEDMGPFGLGILPSIRKQVMKSIPMIRNEIRKIIDEALGAIKERKGR